jgi:hypothetical protein
MSADNCIAVLITPSPDGKEEYRVIATQAIDNIYYDPRKKHYENNTEGNPKEIVKYFSSAKVFHNKNLAYQEANRLEEEVGWTEYGILDIELPHTYSTYEKNKDKEYIR